MEEDAHWFHSFELLENTSGHGYVSTRVLLVSNYCHQNEYLIREI